MTTTVETRLGDRLDLLAGVYLQDPMKWEQITALNPGLNLTSGLYLEPGLYIEIPALVPEKIPDLLPWNNTEEVQLFEPVEVPPDVQPGAAPDELLSGSGWLTPAQIKVLLGIQTYNLPLTIEEGGTNATTAEGARNNLGAVSLSELTTGLSLKADTSAVASALALKADLSSVVSALALKLDTATFNTAIALKLDVSAFNTAIALKADTSALTAGLALKADTSALTAGLAAKIDSTSKNVANGVAGLDTNGLVFVSQIPSSVQFSLQARTNTTAFDLNSLGVNHAAIKWVDNNAGNLNLPSGALAGALIQHDPLNGVAGNTNLYKTQTFFNYSNRVWDRQQNNGAWGSWLERSYLNRAQSFLNLQDFAAGATFKGGSNPATSPSLTQAGVDSGGIPRYWLVNSAAPANNRIKSISVANNGDIEFRHYNDDLSEKDFAKYTGSGNLLFNGTLRTGSGSSAFSGASFLPGAIYHRTDLTTQSINTSGTLVTSTGSLTVSDGERWRYLDGTDTAIPNKVIVTGTLPASIAANTFTNFGTFNAIGWAYIDSLYAISVNFQFTDGTVTYGHWQMQGGCIMSCIQWKAGGTQNAVNFKMEHHNGADFICSARWSISNVNRVLQLSFDTALNFLALSTYRITLKRLI